jgi:hypothetical protein
MLLGRNDHGEIAARKRRTDNFLQARDQGLIAVVKVNGVD